MLNVIVIRSWLLICWVTWWKTPTIGSLRILQGKDLSRIIKRSSKDVTKWIWNDREILWRPLQGLSRSKKFLAGSLGRGRVRDWGGMGDVHVASINGAETVSMPTIKPLIPKLCDNARNELYWSLKQLFLINDICWRYYVAEGVRIYSQQSWKMVVGTEGKHMVEKYITETVSAEFFAW